jgi:phosphatidylserine/phosphatidylglycerophosphate/cardiolipin synthase-like enzyme
VRILIGEFWGSNSLFDWLTSDDSIISYAETPGDGLEFMGQGNAVSGVFELEIPRFSFGDRVRDLHVESSSRQFEQEDPIPSSIPPYVVDMTDWPLVNVEAQIASWHQKFSVIDHRVTYIGGMNVKSTDWDSSEHLVFDHRRMNFDAAAADRQAVMNKEREPDLGPRRDYVLRIEGPAAQDAADVFQRRWSQAIADRETLWDVSTDFTVNRDIAAFADGTQVQVTATMPAPFHEYAIAETWFSAVAQAEKYIYIEDQYWRIPWLAEAIIERMREVPALKLIVITKVIDEWLDPGCEWTAITHDWLMSEFGPARYRTYVLRSFDSVVRSGINETQSLFVNIDTHSKMFIVDDKFMSIGSCNKNNRGLMYEGELNAAVLDPVLVANERRRIFANLLPQAPPSDEVDVWWQDFVDAAAWNDAVDIAWQTAGGAIDNGDGSWPLPDQYEPRGLVYSLDFRLAEWCFLEGVGPDMTFR